MNIPCEVTTGFQAFPVESIWDFNPDDPWIFKLSFVDQTAVWLISLDLVTEALTGPTGEIHGSGDVQVEAMGECLFIHLDPGYEPCTLIFPSSDVEEFLNEIDTSNAQMVIGQKLDEFLETL